jgi:hypothetical protein
MRKSLLLAAMFAVGCGGAVDSSMYDTSGNDVAPSGRGATRESAPVVETAKPGGNAAPGANGISYHGGPVLGGTVNVYFIWYGNWTGNAATTILTDLASNIGGSPYFNINKTYTGVTGAVHYAGSTTDSYSQGASFTDSAVATIVSSAITSGRLPKDTNGVYFVLTSADVHETSGFCTSWCGWHTHGTISGSDIKYSIVSDPSTQCPASCSMQQAPNGNLGADAMASILSHELEEATTDPDLNAWYDTRGYENADKCAWTFGTTYAAANGATANVKIGTRDYLIQRNWVNASGGYCSMQ